jgi:hypothetical protein
MVAKGAAVATKFGFAMCQNLSMLATLNLSTSISSIRESTSSSKHTDVHVFWEQIGRLFRCIRDL